ncbi:MAG: multicomponent Na+:H+ antiporter subunit F [Chloroflexi bacterium]|nr:MAG: multicomponent Na+:H+ antiporter subunit F [Chloroflexota bacterium]
MTTLVLYLAVLLALLMAASMYRLIKGPTIFDRMVAAGAMGTKSLLLLAFVGFLYGRTDVFVDLAIAYGLLNFISAIVVAKYFERRREEAP